LVGHSDTIQLLPCGWSEDGLQTFNKIARELIINRKENGDEFDKVFKTRIEQEMASSATTKNGKRKRQCVETYNDLQGELVTTKGEDNSDDESEHWVQKNVFMV
jgi:hypothetical protein